ncbi:MAG: cyclic nucleotide-binding domain-containing protein [Rhodocyclaceae bacterium]|nr:cyclic nucleotide-binding domain-containing protein [Rhodocyclaceae bacterium]
MSANDRFRSFENLGDATPFVARILDIMDYIRVFAGFERAEIEALARYMRCYRVAAGIEVIVEGEPGDFMLLLIEGNMEIAKKDHRGLPVRIADANPGKTLGEMSVIDGEPRFASCVTVTEAVIAVLGRDELMRLVGEKPQLGVKLLMQMAVLLNQRLRQVSLQYMKVLDESRKLAA